MKYKFRRYYLYYLGRVAAFIVYLLPIDTGLYIAKIIGGLAFWILGPYREIAVSNLKNAFAGEKVNGEIRRIARKVFENLAKNAVELINFPKIKKTNIDKFVAIKNRDILDNAFKPGRGIIIVTAHFGNWELMAATLRLKGYPGVTIGRRIYFEKYDRYLNGLRKIHDVDIIYRDESPRRALKILKSNQIVGVVADQDVDSASGVFVNFFGLPAYTPIGPVALAKASGASLIPVFIIRENNRHILIIEKAVELIDTGNKEEDLARNTQEWSDVLESYIRRYPEQWVWMHRRWKTKRPQN